MKVLILGGDGMLGHKAFHVMSGSFDVYATFRAAAAERPQHPVYSRVNPKFLLRGVDALNFDSIKHALEQAQPDAVVNCIGIVKQREQAHAAIPSILINALLPHQLAELCARRGARLVHISTDCVFSGKRGSYTEADIPDPSDLYGRSKLLGELNQPGCLTLRTSMIGWELKNRLGLLEWFAAQRGKTIKGYRRAIYSGFSTAVLAQLVRDILQNQPELTGLYHLASQPISKHDLLLKLRQALAWHDIHIEPDDAFQCDRSLDSACFQKTSGWRAPTWDMMIQGLASEWSDYSRGSHLS